MDGGSLQQNTDNRRARIYYPFYPLAGQSLWIRERRKGPPPTYTPEAPSGECFNVPIWMTEESTAKLHLEDGPRLHVRKLLEIIARMLLEAFRREARQGQEVRRESC